MLDGGVSLVGVLIVSIAVLYKDSLAAAAKAATSLVDGVFKNQRERAILRNYVRGEALPKHNNSGKEVVDEEDLVTLLSILVKIGQVRIQRLSLGTWYDPFVHPEDNDTIVFRTHHPDSTKISWCRIGCHSRGPAWDFSKIQGSLARLQALEALVLENCSSFQLADAVTRFPFLKHLKISFHEKTSVGLALASKGESSSSNNINNNCNNNTSLPFRSTAPTIHLQTLELSAFEPESEDALSDFLLDVLPLFPRLAVFRVYTNTLRSFRRVAERIRNHLKNTEHGTNDNHNGNNHHHPLAGRAIVNSTLRVLDLGVPVFDSEETSVEPHNQLLEASAMVELLSAFSSLSQVRGFFGTNHLGDHPSGSDPSVETLLILNEIGRSLVVRDANAHHSTATTTTTTTTRQIPSSLWPVVLERAWKRNHRRRSQRNNTNTTNVLPCPTGIFYLLQNVRALQRGSERSEPTNRMPLASHTTQYAS